MKRKDVVALRFVLGFVGLAAAMLAIPATAKACIFLAPACVGSRSECNPSRAERRERDRRSSAEETRRLAVEARRRLEGGGVDFAAELAALLVPNVRPTFANETDCGWMGEPDSGPGRETADSLVDRALGGTPLENQDRDDLSAALLRSAPRFGTPCNREFRQRAATFLRAQLGPDQLRAAWLFLKPRQRGSYPPLVRFQGEGRTPPVLWAPANEWLRDQAQRFARKVPAGRALVAAMDQFWAGHDGQLGDDNLVCPAALAQWRAERGAWLREMTAWVERRDARRRNGLR